MDHQNKKTNGHSPKHIPVLLNQVMQYLAPEEGDTYLDATAGYGGHAEAILERTLQDNGSLLVDQDEQAIQALQEKFHRRSLQIMKNDFAGAAKEMKQQGRAFDIILADVGVSSVHLDNASRGFSIQQSGPLDMRMDKSQELTAEMIVNTWSRDEIIMILQDYGEEFRARRIVDAIIDHRPIKTTQELAKIVAHATRMPRGKKHPATKTFQALRIAVNDELGQLKEALPIWVELLKPGGRLGIITFHSLEDRIVKEFFAEHAHGGYDANLRAVTKKAVMPEQSEIVSNPRSRSAKLRIAVKIKNERST